MKEKAMSERARCVRCGHTVDLAGQCPNCMAERPETIQTRLPPVDDGRDDCLPQAGWRHPGHCQAPERPESERSNPYLDPAPKTPETLAEVVGELEDVAEWAKHGTLGSIKMRELRQKVIKAAIIVKGCASTWEFEREHRPGMREAPMPGEHSSKMLDVRRELESIVFAIDGYLQAKTDRSEKGNILERLKQVVAATNGLQNAWLSDEYALGSQARELALLDAERKEPLKHLLLFFGPSVADDRTTKEMARTGTLPEDQMDDRINQLMREGWRVVFRHFDPSFHVEQWRVILEKP